MRSIDARTVRICQTFYYNGGTETHISSYYNAYDSAVCEWNHQVWVLIYLIRNLYLIYSSQSENGLFYK